MSDGYTLTEIAKKLGRPASWVSERLASLRNELLLATGHFFPLSEPEYESLSASIAEHGVQVPVVIGEHIACVDGRHRILVSRELGLADVPAIFLSGLDAETERQLSVTLNAARRQITNQQKRTLVEAELTRDPARSDRLIAAICGMTHPTVATIRAAMAEQQRAEGLTVDSGSSTIGPGGDVTITHSSGVTVTTGSETGQRAPVDPPRRVGATGKLRTVPARPSEPREPAVLAYVTCAHGQVHSLRRVGGEYVIKADRD